jgi:hypothetical protein
MTFCYFMGEVEAVFGCEIVCCRLRCVGLTLKFGCLTVDNQFTAPDDFGIDNQLRPWDWFGT